MADAKHTPEQAATDLRRYGRALRTTSLEQASQIERAWGLHGYSPEIVSTVLSAVATGLPLDAAIDEATS
jgi:hypothetical protein